MGKVRSDVVDVEGQTDTGEETAHPARPRLHPWLSSARQFGLWELRERSASRKSEAFAEGLIYAGLLQIEARRTAAAAAPPPKDARTMRKERAAAAAEKRGEELRALNPMEKLKKLRRLKSGGRKFCHIAADYGMTAAELRALEQSAKPSAPPRKHRKRT